MAGTPHWLWVADQIVSWSNRWAGRDAAHRISLDTLNAGRWRVPLPLVMERIWRFNCPRCLDPTAQEGEPQLSPMARRQLAGGGYIGGVAMLPLSYAEQEGVDPRDAWSSCFLLMTRLQGIGEHRARQYSDLWGAGGCTGLGETGMAVLSYANAGFGDILGELLREHASIGWRALSQGAVQERRVTGPDVMPDVPHEVCVQGVLSSVSARFDPSPENYRGVCNDLGFWKAVLLEERFVLPAVAGVTDARGATMDRLWTEYLRGGFPGYMGQRPGSGAAAAALWYYGLVFTTSIYGWMADVAARYNDLEAAVRARLQLSASDVDGLRAAVGDVEEIVARAEFSGEKPSWAACWDVGGCTGRVDSWVWEQPEWVGRDSWNPAQVPRAALRAATTIGWTRAVAAWAGELYQEPPVIEPPRPRPEEDEEEEPPTAAKRQVHPAIPFAVGAAIPLFGYLIIREAGKTGRKA